ncbi:uncharacterized protein LOC106073134 isoform X1 [Biomphalaria glabrata]|uniref:Uncharacterized protein LOC106073134 isoform X1 n=1 Tax=Biomphalaria glabrata TaxID=6526 RepID=A0A9U8EIW8_BIOGL|nr:uncharacterized protein LOC106073134 isoform X1 [Biomphalaria glabrata]
MLSSDVPWLSDGYRVKLSHRQSIVQGLKKAANAIRSSSSERSGMTRPKSGRFSRVTSMGNSDTCKLRVCRQDFGQVENMNTSLHEYMQSSTSAATLPKSSSSQYLYRNPASQPMKISGVLSRSNCSLNYINSDLRPSSASDHITRPLGRPRSAWSNADRVIRRKTRSSSLDQASRCLPTQMYPYDEEMGTERELALQTYVQMYDAINDSITNDEKCQKSGTTGYRKSKPDQNTHNSSAIELHQDHENQMSGSHKNKSDWDIHESSYSHKDEIETNIDAKSAVLVTTASTSYKECKANDLRNSINDVKTNDGLKSLDEVKGSSKLKASDELNSIDELKGSDELNSINELKASDELNSIDELKASDELKSIDEIKVSDELNASIDTIFTNELQNSDEEIFAKALEASYDDSKTSVVEENITNNYRILHMNASDKLKEPVQPKTSEVNSANSELSTSTELAATSVKPLHSSETATTKDEVLSTESLDLRSRTSNFLDKRSTCNIPSYIVQGPDMPNSLHCKGTSIDLKVRPRNLLCADFLKRPYSGQARSRSQVKQYIDSHRPQTAPVTRQDLQNFTAFKQHAYLPHYCHFVRGITLKGRGGGGDHEDEADDGYITNSEPSPLGSDIDLLRRSGRLRSGHVNSRSSSPIEQDNEPVSQMSRLSVGVDNGGSTSRQDLSCVGPDSGVFTGRLDLTYAETEGRKDLTSEKSVAEVESYETWDAHRPPIRIPSPDIEPVESSRNKIDEMADIVRELTTKTTKDVARAELTSATSRRLCPKKGKSSGTRGRKRRGKKKKHGDGSNQEKDGGESTLIADLKDGQFPQADGDALTAVNLNVPDLPSVNGGKQGKQSKGVHTKKNRTQIAAPVMTEKMKEAPPPPVYNFYDFGDLTDTKPDEMENAVPNVVPIPANLNDRMVLTLQSSRFELPMDMRELENLTPQDYLKKYCVVTPRRKLLYTKTFQDYRDKKGFILGKSSLCSALTCVLINSMDNDQAEQLCDLLEVDDKTEVDFDLFSGIAALAERILYPYFVTAETWDRTEFQKEMIECADFCALEWKLRGVNVSNQVKKILKSL